MNRLPKVKQKRAKRLGRGYGSGKGGHTSGRGTKGQKARTSIGILFEGTKMKKSYIKRLPFRRGKGKFKAQDKPVIVKLSYLEMLPSGSKIDLALLIKNNIVKESDAKEFGVKVLGDDKEIKKKLIVSLPISKSAAKKVEKAGGEVVKS